MEGVLAGWHMWIEKLCSKLRMKHSLSTAASTIMRGVLFKGQLDFGMEARWHSPEFAELV